MTEEKERKKANEIFDKVTKALQHIEEEVVIFPPDSEVEFEEEDGKVGDKGDKEGRQAV